MIWSILRTSALNGVTSSGVHFGSHDPNVRLGTPFDPSSLSLSKNQNGGGWCLYVDQSMVKTATMMACYPVSAEPWSAMSGSWVLTGGTGALGLLTADHLAQHGIHRVLMLGRTGHLSTL